MLFVSDKNNRRFMQLLKYGVLCLITMLLASTANAQNSKTRKINCDANTNKTINKLIKRSRPGDIILIRGTCVENINLNKGVTLDGRGTGSIISEDPTVATISVSARNATIKGLVLDSAIDGTQIYITDRSLVTIENNDIGNASAYGIAVFDASSASVVGNRIYGNGTGVFAAETSTLRIGFKSLSVDEVLPNIIESNNNGVVIARAFANISGNQIINNFNIGVVIARSASARVAGNEISGNRFGIFNGSNSTTDLALNEDGIGLFGSPNFGINSQVSLLCNSGFISGIVGENFGAAVALDPCESQLIFPSAPAPAP